jgi:CRISPR-associated protein Cmr3
MTAILEIACRDPIVSRDSRPFGAGQGNRMRSLGWPLPSVLAGALRTTLGKQANRDFSATAAEDLLQVEVAGPFPLLERQLYLPAPEDCVVHRDWGALRAAPRPFDQGGGDWPKPSLLPVHISDTQAPDDFKPEETPAWWPAENMAAWLAGDKITFDDRFLRAPEIDHRTHVHLDPLAGAAEEAALFTTSALALSHLPLYRTSTSESPRSRFAAITLAARVRASGWCGETAARLDTLHPLGGERRLVHWKAAADSGAWRCPQKIREKLATAVRVRMVLATPAVFRDGWKPGWLNSELVGAPPGTTATLRLIGISIQRWRAISGWSLLNNPPAQRPGPKPVKRVVPAGGVYFFEMVAGKASDLADRWLESVSDDGQDQRYGFGLAVWGNW